MGIFFKSRKEREKELEQRMKDYTDNQIKQVRNEIDEIRDEISSMKIKLHDSDIKAILNDRGLTNEEFMNIIYDIKDTLVNLKDSEHTMYLILDAIDKKRNKKVKSNKQRPQRPNTISQTEPEIDREFEKEKRFAELRKKVSCRISDKQLSWLCDIELDLPEAPKFTGITYQEFDMYMKSYKDKHAQWKKDNKISRAPKTEKGVCYSYGK